MHNSTISIKAVKNGTQWTIRKGYESILDKINLDNFRSILNGKPYKLIKETKVRSVISIPGSDISDDGIYIKYFKRKGYSDYVKYLFTPTRTRTEWKVANRLLSKGINTALPLAIAEKRSWSLLDSSMLITKAVSRSEPLMEFCQTTFNGILSGEKLFEKKKLLNNLAGFIRNIHEKGFFHSDLHAGNILIKFNNDYFSPVKDYSFYLMDLHRVKILKGLSSRKRLHNLAQIFNSLSSILTKSDRLSFVKSYGINALSNIRNERVQYQVTDHPVSPPSQGGEKGEVTKSNGMLLDIEQLLVEKIESQSSRIRNIHYRSRLKRCMKESSNFSRTKLNDMRIFFRKGYDTNSFPELIEKHHNALANNDKDVILKRDSKTALTRFPFKDDVISNIVVKQYKTSCGLCLIKNIFRNSAGRKAWVAGNGLSVYGFNSARPLALIEKNILGIVTDSYLIMEDATHSLEMDRYILKNFHGKSSPGELERKRTFISDFAKTIAKMHSQNIFHSDLKTCNIMVKEEASKSFDFIFLDFDKVTFNEDINIQKRINNLTQINLSTPGCITFTDRFRFLREYLKPCDMEDEKKDILREIINISKTEKILYVSFKGDVTEDW
jgi:tRNA A-37 threonylcarbamoyl transferase component Bud32